MMKIKATLKEPDSVWYSSKEENHHFYKWFEATPVSEKYLLVVVKFLNDEGFVVTAFFVSRMRRKDKVLVYGKEDTDSLW